MLNLGELATRVQEGVPVITCVFNDRRHPALPPGHDVRGRRTAVDLHAGLRDVGAVDGDAVVVGGVREEFEAFTATVETADVLIDVDITGFEPMRIVPQSPSAPRRVR